MAKDRHARRQIHKQIMQKLDSFEKSLECLRSLIRLLESMEEEDGKEVDSVSN